MKRKPEKPVEGIDSGDDSELRIVNKRHKPNAVNDKRNLQQGISSSSKARANLHSDESRNSTKQSAGESSSSYLQAEEEESINKCGVIVQDILNKLDQNHSVFMKKETERGRFDEQDAFFADHELGDTMDHELAHEEAFNFITKKNIKRTGAGRSFDIALVRAGSGMGKSHFGDDLIRNKSQVGNNLHCLWLALSFNGWMEDGIGAKSFEQDLIVRFFISYFCRIRHDNEDKNKPFVALYEKIVAILNESKNGSTIKLKHFLSFLEADFLKNLENSENEKSTTTTTTALAAGSVSESNSKEKLRTCIFVDEISKAVELDRAKFDQATSFKIDNLDEDKQGNCTQRMVYNALTRSLQIHRRLFITALTVMPAWQPISGSGRGIRWIPIGPIDVMKWCDAHGDDQEGLFKEPVIRALYAMSGGHPRTMQWIQDVIQGIELGKIVRATNMKGLPQLVTKGVLSNSKCLFKSYKKIEPFVFAALTNEELPLQEGGKLTTFGNMVSDSLLLNSQLSDINEPAVPHLSLFSLLGKPKGKPKSNSHLQWNLYYLSTFLQDTAILGNSHNAGRFFEKVHAHHTHTMLSLYARKETKRLRLFGNNDDFPAFYRNAKILKDQKKNGSNLRLLTIDTTLLIDLNDLNEGSGVEVLEENTHWGDYTLPKPGIVVISDKDTAGFDASFVVPIKDGNPHLVLVENKLSKAGAALDSSTVKDKCDKVKNELEKLKNSDNDDNDDDHPFKRFDYKDITLCFIALKRTTGNIAAPDYIPFNVVVMGKQELERLYGPTFKTTLSFISWFSENI